MVNLVDAGRSDGRATYDVVNNKLAMETKFADEPARRLDRVIANKEARFSRYEIKITTQSDHYGVFVVME